MVFECSNVNKVTATVQSYFDGNSIITNAIRFVTMEEVPTVYVLTGNGASIPDTAFCNEMDLHGYGLRSLPSLASIPEACNVMMIYMPTTDLTAAEEGGLREYLNGGGKLYLIYCLVYTVNGTGKFLIPDGLHSASPFCKCLHVNFRRFTL